MNRFTPASPRVRKICRSAQNRSRPRTSALVFAVFALSFQLSGLAADVQQREVKKPVQTERKAVAQPAPQSPGAIQQITVLTPAAGQTIALDGKVLQIQFGYKNLDVKKSYSFMPELMRNGAALGQIFGTGFVVNPWQSSAVVGVTSGHYLANFTSHLAQPGPGYQYRITIYEGTWGKGHKVVAAGLSGQFTFGAAPVPAGLAQVTVLTPTDRQTIALDGKVLQIQFGYKNLDVNKHYSFMPELMKNGAALGQIFGTGFVVNKSQSSAVVGVTSGHYLANFTSHLAQSGPGYQYRITIYEGTWGKGHKVVAAGLSGQFTFGAAPVPAGPAQVTVLTPTVGQTLALDGKVLQIQFGYKNLDVNKHYSFMPELMKNGAALGPVFGGGFVVNKSQSSAVVGVTSGYYLANFAGKTASAGSGYQYRITIYEGTWGQGHKVTAAGLSGQFTFK